MYVCVYNMLVIPMISTVTFHDHCVVFLLYMYVCVYVCMYQVLRPARKQHLDSQTYLTTGGSGTLRATARLPNAGTSFIKAQIQTFMTVCVHISLVDTCVHDLSNRHGWYFMVFVSHAVCILPAERAWSGTPLHRAARGGHKETCITLLDMGASLSET